MKALSLHQPWAVFVAASVKKYETRDWTTSYRGLLAIHAAGKYRDGFPPEVYGMVEGLKFDHPEIQAALTGPLTFGAVICVCELKAIYRTQDVFPHIRRLERDVGDYTAGRAAWELEVVKVYDEPIVCRGQMGLWEWSEP